MLAARLEEANAQAIASTEPAFLAKYTFNLAKASISSITAIAS